MADLRTKVGVKIIDPTSALDAPVLTLADNFANGEALGVAAFGMVWDGATWDRMLGDQTDGVLVNLGSNNGVVVDSAGIDLMLGTDFSDVLGTALLVLTAGVDALINTTDTLLTSGMMYAFNGTEWDRVREGSEAGSILVDLGANNAVTVSGSVDTELPAAAALSADNVASPTAPAVGAFGHYFDGTNWDRMLGDETDGLLVNLGSNNTVVTELPTAVALTDDFANPTVPNVGAFLMGWDGTDWDRVAVTDNGRLQVDVITGGGTDSPTNPTIDTDIGSAIAAGSPDDLDSAEIAEGEKLWQVHISASVPFKFQIKAVEDGTPRNVSAIMFGRAGETVIWDTPHRNFVEHAGVSAGLDVFRATVTNMDNSEAADLHAAFYYST